VSQLQARCNTIERGCDCEEVNLPSSDDSGAWMAIWWLTSQNSKTVVKLNKCSSGQICCWPNTRVLSLVRDEQEQEQVDKDSKHEVENNQHYYKTRAQTGR